MAKLLLIYFSALAVCTLLPTKVSTIPFINLSQSIQFEIDPSSPALSVEKDFLETQQPVKQQVHFANLNAVVGKPFVQAKATAVVKSEIPTRILDYSTQVRKDTGVHVKVSGPLELRQGLALTDENRIEVHRENKGAVIEYGEVDIQKGTYSINLSGFEGHICARLRGSRYETVGEGCFALERVKNFNQMGPLLSVSQSQELLAAKETKKPELPEPSPQSEPEPQQKTARQEPSPIMQEPKRLADRRFVDFYDMSNPDAKPLNVQTVTSTEGKEDAQSVIISTLITRNHPPARMIANSSTPDRGANIPGNSALDALEKMAADQGLTTGAMNEGGKVWGRTMKDGMTIAGVSVEVEGRDDLRPVYLNEFYMPDPNLRATASHGLYTFLHVPEGEYSIRATQGNQFMGFQNVSVREETLSLGDIDATERRRNVRISMYDLVNKTSQNGVATLQNYDEDIILEDGIADIQVQDTKDTAFALVNPLDKRYLTAQYILNPKDELYNFPLVKSEWVESILSRAKLQRPVKDKIVLGFGAQKSFQVQALGSKTAQVVYFDSNGEVVEGQFGTAGGGFFILDPENSVHEYAIQQAGEKSVRAIYMPTTSNVVNVIQL